MPIGFFISSPKKGNSGRKKKALRILRNMFQKKIVMHITYDMHISVSAILIIIINIIKDVKNANNKLQKLDKMNAEIDFCAKN